MVRTCFFFESTCLSHAFFSFLYHLMESKFFVFKKESTEHEFYNPQKILTKYKVSSFFDHEHQIKDVSFVDCVERRETEKEG